MLYIHSSTVPRELLSVSRRLVTIHSPSGDHAGELVVWSASRLTGRGREPSASMTHTFSVPPRSVVKAMRLPSGDQRACMSYAMPEVKRFARPPAIGSV